MYTESGPLHAVSVTGLDNWKYRALNAFRHFASGFLQSANASDYFFFGSGPRALLKISGEQRSQIRRKVREDNTETRKEAPAAEELRRRKKKEASKDDEKRYSLALRLIGSLLVSEFSSLPVDLCPLFQLLFFKRAFRFRFLTKVWRAATFVDWQ